MHFQTLKWSDLSDADRGAWDAFRAATPGLYSPYFDRGWFDAVSAARGDLRVVRGSRDGRAVAFLPYHPSPIGLARPGGANFCDWHGFVSEPGVTIDARAALACAAPAFRFDAAPRDDAGFGGLGRAESVSHLVDLADGFEAYARPPGGRAAPKAVANFRRAMRKLEADGRAVTVTVEEDDDAPLRDLMRLKSQQYRASGHPDALSWDWSRRLIDALPVSRDGRFGRVLSSLWIDGVFAAGHLGLRSGPVIHHWLPAFERDFSSYAPGHLLAVEIAKAAPDQGVTTMDLGPGDYVWKREFANSQAPLVSGIAYAASMQGAVAVAANRSSSKLAALGKLGQLPQRAFGKLERSLTAVAPSPS